MGHTLRSKGLLTLKYPSEPVMLESLGEPVGQVKMETGIDFYGSQKGTNITLPLRSRPRNTGLHGSVFQGGLSGTSSS